MAEEKEPVSKGAERLHNAKSLYLDAILNGNIDAVDQYTGDRYTQHSTGVKDGQAGFKEFFSGFLARCPVREIKVVRAIVDERYVFVHVYQNIGNGESVWVTTDFFDFDENNKIVEHWDVIAAYSDTTPSGHTSIDGPTEVTDLEKTDDNKALVRKMIEDVLMEGGNRENIGNYISSETYIQHNKDVPDGIQGIKDLVSMENTPLVYKEIVIVAGQGNFVATLCKAEWEGSPNCQVDIFRIEDGLIVEHWDNVEPVPEVHANGGKF
jgi:predicted SnoaL-like aldol condensation-catalyzing enzyme